MSCYATTLRHMIVTLNRGGMNKTLKSDVLLLKELLTELTNRQQKTSIMLCPTAFHVGVPSFL